MSVDTSDLGFRQRFYEEARRREADLDQTFKRAGVDQLTLSTEEDMVLSILRFAAVRNKARRRPQ